MAGAAPNPNGEVELHDEPLVRRSFGRRKSCKGSETTTSMVEPAGKKKKKKVPQRGMGVEKLERQRIEQEWNKMKQISHQPPAAAFITPTNFMPPPPPPPNVVDHLIPKLTPLMTPHHYKLQQAFHGFPNSDLFFNHSQFLPSKDLSSTPNSLNCNFQHCNACHKKKKEANIRRRRNLGSEVGDCGFLGMNFIDNQNKEEIATKLLSLVGDANKGGELVAVHRKGGSASSDDQRMVMEYDFFPSSSSSSHKADDNDDDQSVMLNLINSSSNSSPNYVDLSLKLSSN